MDRMPRRKFEESDRAEYPMERITPMGRYQMGGRSDGFNMGCTRWAEYPIDWIPTPNGGDTSWVDYRNNWENTCAADVSYELDTRFYWWPHGFFG